MLNYWFQSMLEAGADAAKVREGLKGTELLESSDTVVYAEVFVNDTIS